MDLAAEFDVSRQHVGRLVRQDQRPVIAAGPDVAQVPDGVTDAVAAFLEDVKLDAGDEVLGSVARSIASKLDGCAASDSSAAAQAVPRLAAELVEVLERLRLSVPSEPDTIDRLRARRATRLTREQDGPGIA